MISRLSVMRLMLALVFEYAHGADIKPQQIHLALAGRGADGAPTGVRVAWYTQDLPQSAAAVQYGVASGSLAERANATSPPRQYLKGYGYHHVVDLLGLSPGQRYFYKVGSDAGQWSEEWSFRAAPAPAKGNKVSMAVFGDWGYLDSKQRPMEITIAGLEKNWSATLTRERLEALRGQLDMIWHLGDIGYADDAFGHHAFSFDYEECYNGFMNWIQNLSATMPYMVSVGNHESECHSPDCLFTSKGRALRNFTAYNARWQMPSSESGGRAGSAMWYSFDYGPVHFTSINTETDWDGAQEQDTGDSGDKLLPAGHFGKPGEYLKWLEEDLRAASERRAAARRGVSTGPRWLVAGGHRPFGDIQGSHIALFEKYGIDLYVAGHAHSYARGAPHNNITYITVGGAGCDEMPYQAECDASDVGREGSKPSRQGPSCKPGYMVPPDTEQFQTKQMAIGVLHADDDLLNWKLLDSATGEVLDQITLGSESGKLAWV